MSADLLERAIAGDTRALARALTRIENGGADGRAIAASAFLRAGRATVIGLTGPPGVGKSSLVDRLTAHYRKRGRRVAVVAVDPSSPFSGGAILGDRIRMSAHFTDPGVFIRSMATRGHLGGLSAATADAVDVLDAAGYDVVLIETIGVGQDDVEVAAVAGITLLVLTPGLGDEVQAMKSGIMEVGDVYVVNKADLPGADRLEGSIRAALSLAGLEDERPVLRTTATEDRGIEALAEAVDGFERRIGAAAADRRAARARERVSQVVLARLLARLRNETAPRELWEALVARVDRREVDPYAAADAILAARDGAGSSAGSGGGLG